ncbi:small glutamine-rich tetratricopeptide repeat-containing protein isoform X2 [Juglans regia]|uniref:Small glutamine-rich tetratricopeptide repeat-containing protein isoform X2 n=2 Tax=Juglans regia TaxID=51240 RepID=A0A2I4DZG5_JUGRE|nr:small glutamine-rich tetratricopeptide repeat-containing protein isoform X2 [Juglans regia]
MKAIEPRAHPLHNAQSLAMANYNLNTDSPISRRIVRAFFDFLNSVEPAPGVDLEGLEVARECLTEAFKLNSSSVDDHIKPNLLVDLFHSLEANEHHEARTYTAHGTILEDARTDTADAKLSEASNSVGEVGTRKPLVSGMSKDELFGQFFAALEKIHFFRTMPDGNDDPVQLEKTTRLFQDALSELERSGCQTLDIDNLAETLKSQGNRAMQSKLYSDAIELYTCAIALRENNAVYYCNRAAAYTQIHQYTEAIRDCMKSIEINPSYSKAYSRLGLAYYAQGNYSDAINKGFKKAMELDPDNDSVKENIRVAEQKLREEQQRTEHDQNTSSTSRGDQESENQSTRGQRSHATPSQFTSIPFGTTAFPADFASMFMNMAASAANAYQGQNSRDGHEEDGHVNGAEDPEVRIGGNINLNFGEQMPEELTGALRSVMEMFTGAASHHNSQDTTEGRPPQN